MTAAEFDEAAFFEAVAASGARALLIGRRAMIVLGLPVLTADYDYWLHIDDVDVFNPALARFELWPNKPPEDARRTGTYKLENDETVDVFVARSIPTVDGMTVCFDELWARRQTIPYGKASVIAVPSYDDLILTKRFGGRRRDVIDIKYIEGLKRAKEKGQ